MNALSSADALLRALLDGIATRFNWCCVVYDHRGADGTPWLRSEFRTYGTHAGQTLRLRSQCDRAPANRGGAIEFLFEMESLAIDAPAAITVTGSDAIRLFGGLRKLHGWMLETEARLPFHPEPETFQGTFDQCAGLADQLSPAQWHWSQIAHEGEQRALETRYETTVENRRLRLHEFRSVGSDMVRCFAQLEWTGDETGPLPSFDALEARVLVALVKRRAHAARYGLA